MNNYYDETATMLQLKEIHLTEHTEICQNILVNYV